MLGRVRPGARLLVGVLVAALMPFGIGSAPADAAVVPAVVAVDAGYAHSCALTSAGGVKCWGYGLHGSLGDGTTVSKTRPVDVDGLASGVRAIDAGGFFSCAILAGGGVRCWGWNRWGQLGDGTTTERTRPVDVSGLTSGVVAIATGGSHACALTAAGGVKCWGSNGGGQLGDGTTTQRLVPVDVVGLPGRAFAIAAGGGHTCALVDGGSLRCWGANFNGVLGAGLPHGSSVPAEVAGLPGSLRAVTAGESHICAMSSGGDMWCWGWNMFGQLGTGTTVSSPVPTAIPGLEGRVTAISAGQHHTCAVLADGTARCWGANRYAGQVGSGTTRDHHSPASVVGLDGADSIAGGGRHTCALVDRGVKCWGGNTYGEIGDGTRVLRRTPVPVDFATHQRVALTGTSPAGSLAAGSAVTFDAKVAPLAAGTTAVVRFEIHRREGTVWRLAARRDVAVDGTGRARLRWTFVTTGGRSVRAVALANAVYAASPWSPRIVYSVE